ncbi:flagellar hook-associated protein FlgK [Dyella subtropica]|uniref:flagellar hook-associated protein FlgK n=1 Tax=Dyella subtropica TaxID=2992127 RepID=UPI0022552107|nr:flagellar hook-associated protein FlgK [Dyella subtropica]
MANLLSTAVSGLNAAQVALNTVGNNISNTNTDGYSRQIVQQVESVTQPGPQYTIGTGVDVVSVQRAYSDYLTQAVWSNNSSLQRATAYNGLAGSLNSLLSNGGDLQGSLDGLYGGFSAVANTPGVSSTRQALLGSASALTTVFNTLGQQLASQQSQVNGKIGSTVQSINSAASSIADLNARIAQSGTTGVPNNLLDQRDAMVKTLSGYLGVSSYNQPDGTVSVYSSNGQALVVGGKSYALSTARDAYDTNRTNVLDSSGTDVTSKISGGSLGALLDFRGNVLDNVQNQLGRAAVALSSSVNAQQAKGLDMNGQQGGPMFSVPSPAVLPNGGNQGSATIAASVSDVSKLTSADYVMRYDGSAWNLKTTAGQNVALTTNADGSLSADGLTLALSGTPKAGDSYLIEPTRQAASGLTMTMTDPNKIAAAAALTTSASGTNTGSAKVAGISVQDASNAALLSNAKVSFPTAGTYQVANSAGTVLASGSYTAGQTISANGWNMTLSGTPAAGDSFAVSANSNGLKDNSNALALAGLADKGVLDGAATSVIAAYGNLTTQVGTVGSQAATGLTTQTSLYNQAVSSQQSVSGVNLDEEAASMVRYQQAYQASAQVISTAQTIFGSLLNAMHG